MIHLVIPDPHCHPEHNNDRADYLSRLIRDIRPDVVINMGDSADFPSLSSYDKGKRSFHGRTYRADVDAHLEFQDRLWGPVKRQKKRMPRTAFLEGNHEYRIQRALDLSPELTNTISFRDLELEDYYNDIVRYRGQTPGTIVIDGIGYSHYSIAGVSGRPIEGEHSAYSLITKQFKSSTVAHSHKLDYTVRPDANGRFVMGLVAGCYLDYEADWAGDINRQWWRGVIVCRNVEDGQYDPQFISLTSLKKAYANE